MRHQALLVAVALSAMSASAMAEHLDAPAPHQKKMKLATVTGFKGREAYVHTDERVRLRQLAALWQAGGPEAVIVVEGSSSIAEDEEASIALGQRRADNVRHWLIQFGVAPDHIIAIGNSREKLGDVVELSVEPNVR